MKWHFVLLLSAVVQLSLCESTEKSPQEASNDCRYEKSAWQECDPESGVQKRILKLKSAESASVNCSLEKFIERPCKKQCKYTKGVWSECTNGSKERVDKLKSEVSTTGCDAERRSRKHCKKQCTYDKSDWSACENGVKTKVLTLVENPANNADCEPVKNISKQCARGGAKAKRFRKKSKENRDSQE